MSIKRKFCMMLVAVMLILCMPAGAYCPDTATAVNVLSADFESAQASKGSFLNGLIGVVDSAHGNSYELLSPSTKGYFYAESDSERYEATSLSFDVYVETNTGRGVLEIIDPVAAGTTSIANGNLHRTLYIRQDGLISTFNTFDYGGNGRGCTEPYEGGKWYHFDIWIDYVLGNVLCYQDGVLIGELPTDGFARFGGFRYVYDDMGCGASHHLDNVNAYNYKTRGRVTTGGIQGIPENFSEGVAFLYPRKENPIGFIFDGWDIGLKATLANGLEKSKKIRVVAELVSESGEIEDSCDEIVSLNSFELKKISFGLKANYFGYHYLRTNVYDGTGSILHRDEFQISTANMPKELIGNDRVGINGHALTGGLDNYGIMDLRRKTELFEKAGVGASRLEIAQEHYTLTSLINGEQQIYTDVAKRDGREKLFILCKISKYLPVTTADINSWKTYVKYICRRFGDEIDYYQVWNEFNAPIFNKGNNTTEEYVELLKITYEIVKEYDPTAKVVCNPGANCNASDGYAQDTIDFMKDLFWKYEGYKYMDIMSIHAYVYNDPEVTIKDNGNSPRERFVYELKDWLKEIGHGDFPVIITEIGYSHSTPSGEYRHAEHFLRYSILHSEDVERIYWYRDINLKFTEDTLGEGWEFQRNLGFVREDNYLASAPYPEYAAKPAFLALCNYNTLMTDAKFESSSVVNNLYDYQYTAADGDRINVAWKRSGTESKTYNTDGRICEVYDIYGNIIKASTPQDTTISVNLSTSPVYIKFASPDKSEMYVDATENRFWIKGNAGKETEISAVLYRNVSGKMEIADIAQGSTNQNGSYSMMIPLGEEGIIGNYVINTGFSNEEDTVFNAVAVDIPGVYLKNDDGIVTDITQIKKGDTLSCVLNTGESDIDGMVTIAQYDKSGGLITVEESDFSAGEDIVLESGVVDTENLSEIKVFVWHKDSMIPLKLCYTIK